MNDKLLSKVAEIVERLNQHEANKRIVYEAVCLRDDSIVKFVNKFIEPGKASADPDESVLDMISSIIVAAKTVYESDKYCDPFDDLVYDKMLSKFKKYRPEPFGNNSIGLANAKYKYDKLSGTLDKVHFIYNTERTELEDRGSLEDFIMSIPGGRDKEYVVLVNQKKDGTSVTIDYEFVNGEYIPRSAISRGKKDYGEGTDVSAIIPDASFSPKAINKAIGFIPKFIGVQYELLVSNAQKEEFEKYTHQKFANNRSAASGLLRRIVFAKKKEARELKKFMSLVPVGFDILDKYVIEDSYYDLDWDRTYVAVCSTFCFGDIGMDYEIIKGTKNKILKEFEKLEGQWLKTRQYLNHAIDGMVMTFVDSNLREKLGRKNNINQYQIAFKFPENGSKTTVRGFEITTGNFGYKEMLLLLDPVVLNGTTQFKAQVHSLDRFESLNLRIGDEIILKLSGDVIPYGYKDETCRGGSGEVIKWPKKCECGAPLIEQNSKLRCSNQDCPFRVIGGLVTFFTQLNAKGIGSRICEQLHKELGIVTPSQVLKLTLDDFLKLNGFKKKSAQLAMDTINDIRSSPKSLASIISALGIDSLRTSTAKKILHAIPYDKLKDMLVSEDVVHLASVLRQCDGIDENAHKIAYGLINKRDELFELVKLIPIESKENKKFDKAILISGFRNDKDVEQAAQSAGFEVLESGSKYDILVIKDESKMNSGKTQKAIAKGNRILTRAQFLKEFG